MSGAAINVRDKKNPTPVEIELQKLISKFTQLQNDRYEADYDVGRKWSRTMSRILWRSLRKCSILGEAFARRR